jgi:hypothetical protein
MTVEEMRNKVSVAILMLEEEIKSLVDSLNTGVSHCEELLEASKWIADTQARYSGRAATARASAQLDAYMDSQINSMRLLQTYLRSVWPCFGNVWNGLCSALEMISYNYRKALSEKRIEDRFIDLSESIKDVFAGITKLSTLAPEALKICDPDWEWQVSGIQNAAGRIREWNITIETAYLEKTARMTRMAVEANERGLSYNELQDNFEMTEGLLTWNQFVDRTHRETFKTYTDTDMSLQLRDFSAEERTENMSMHPRNNEKAGTLDVVVKVLQRLVLSLARCHTDYLTQIADVYLVALQEATSLSLSDLGQLYIQLRSLLRIDGWSFLPTQSVVRQSPTGGGRAAGGTLCE